MKRVLMQQLIQAAGEMNLKTLGALVKMAETMAEKYPEPMEAPTGAALVESELWKVSVKTLAPEVGAHQLLVDMRSSPEVRAN